MLMILLMMEGNIFFQLIRFLRFSLPTLALGYRMRLSNFAKFQWLTQSTWPRWVLDLTSSCFLADLVRGETVSTFCWSSFWKCKSQFVLHNLQKISSLMLSDTLLKSESLSSSPSLISLTRRLLQYVLLQFVEFWIFLLDSCHCYGVFQLWLVFQDIVCNCLEFSHK